MKKIKKILIFVLCAFAVLFTVGFSNVKAADGSTITYNKDSFTSLSGTIDLIDNPSISYDTVACGANDPFLTSGKIRLYSSSGNGNEFSTTTCPADYKIDKITIGLSTSKGKPFVQVYGKNDTTTWTKIGAEIQVTTTGDHNISFATGDYKYLMIKNVSPSKQSNKWPQAQIESLSITYVSNKPIVKYTVEFESNGGSIVPSQSIKEGTNVEEPVIPTLEGYEFGGWYTTSTFEENTLFDFTSAVNSNLKLYAKWNKVEGSYGEFIKLQTKSSLNFSYTTTSKPSQFTKVSIAPTDWSGEYLIVAENAGNAAIFNGSDDIQEYLTTINNTSIENTDFTEPRVITISKFNNGYSISYNGQYLTCTDRDVVLSDTASEFAISLEQDGNAKIYLNGLNKQLRFNSSHFRFYKGATGSKVYLYKGNGNKLEVQTASLRFGMMIPASEYDKMKKDGAKYGLSLIKNANNTVEHNFECAPVRVNEKGVEDAQGAFYQFAVVLENIPSVDFKVTVTARCYVEIAGVKHYAIEKESSVQLTAKDYIDATDTSAYTEHLGVLGFLAK